MNPAHQQHLIKDAQLAEDLAVRYADTEHKRLTGYMGLPFEALTNDKLEAARTGNWFLETNLVIARLDKLSATRMCNRSSRHLTAGGI